MIHRWAGARGPPLAFQSEGPSPGLKGQSFKPAVVCLAVVSFCFLFCCRFILLFCCVLFAGFFAFLLLFCFALFGCCV